MFQEKRTLIFLDMTDFIKKLEVSIYFHRPLFTKRRLSSINSTPRIERRLETTLPRLESILKKSCGRASPKEISTGFIWKWWYLRRLPGHNRDRVHTRFNSSLIFSDSWAENNYNWSNLVYQPYIRPLSNNWHTVILLSTQPFATLFHFLDRSRLCNCVHFHHWIIVNHLPIFILLLF